MAMSLLELCEEYLKMIEYIGSGLYHMDKYRGDIHGELASMVAHSVHPDNADTALAYLDTLLHDLPEGITAQELETKIEYDIIGEFERIAGRFL